jgi:hypothetical protein
VIQGIRALPWFQDALRRNDGMADGYDCKRCKMTQPQLIRMSRGCGYEPPAERTRLTVWQPPMGKVGYRGPDLTTCPGYTCNLPEVLEVALAHVHWSKGNASILGLNEEMQHAVVILDGQQNQLQHWSMTDVKDGGGRE